MPKLSVISALTIVTLVACANSVSAVTCMGKVATIVGTNGSDILAGTTGPDVIQARSGDDEVHSFGGSDSVCGAWGRDFIAGGPSRDLLDGNAGNDEIEGGGGDDTIHGGIDNDTLRGGDRNDDLHGWTGNDDLFGGNGEDFLDGEAGHDRLRAADPPLSGFEDRAHGGADADCIDLFGPDNAAWGEGGEDSFFAYFRPWVDCGSALDAVNYHDVVPPDGLYNCEFVVEVVQPITCFGLLSLTEDNNSATVAGQDDGAALEIRRVKCGFENVIGASESVAAEGQFCFVSFDFTNTTDTSLWLDTQCQILVDDTGVEYIPHQAATGIVTQTYSNDNAIAPGDRVEDVGLVYDIPKEATAASVQLHSSCGSSGFTVDLRSVGDANSWDGYSMTATGGR